MEGEKMESKADALLRWVIYLLQISHFENMEVGQEN